jgi:micrococcal nuclease
VVAVVDGDTIVVGDPGSTPVRLIGVNAPEHDECFGPEAARELQTLLDGAKVRLATDVEETDQYGRLLAYVYLGDELINRTVVERGLAIARPYPPNTSLQGELAEAMKAARSAGAGLWGACSSPWLGTIVVTDVAADPPGPDEDRLADETITLSNVSERTVDLTGWTLRDGSSVNRYRFGSVLLPPGAAVTIHSGCGEDSAGDRFWCASGPVWNNDADIAMLLDSAGHTVDVFAYAH